VVGDRLESHRLDTANGPVQIVTLPWLTKSTLLTRPETDGLSMAQVNELLLDRLRVALEGEIRRLDPEIPAILLAHAMVDTATYGAERFLSAGRGFTVPMAMLARPCFDYVALGHVHRHQVLCEQPLMIYPGSIERVDFSEESEEKGYLLVQVSKDNAQAEFCPLPVRPFKTIQADLTQAENPQACLENAIAKAEITDAVVRCLYTLRADQVDQIDQSALETALTAAHSYTLQPELKAQTSRSRLPELGTDSALDPLAALGAYLANRSDLEDIAEGMVAAAAALMADETDVELPLDETDLALDDLDSLALEETAQQLRLL
jgi:exonuclease SbcD